MMPDNAPESESTELETIHWTKVRCFNIPPNAQMLTKEGFTRKLTCVLKSECPRLKPAKTRMVIFDKNYAVSRLNKILSQLEIDQESLGDLLG